MYEYLRVADTILHQFGAERVVISNEADRKLKQSVLVGHQEINDSLMAHGENDIGKWIVSSVTQLGRIWISIAHKTLGYPIDSGFMLNKWEILHSKLNYFTKPEKTTIKFESRKKPYTSSVVLRDKEATFKINLFPFNYVLKDFQFGKAYADSCFLCPVVSTYPCVITVEQINKLSKICTAFTTSVSAEMSKLVKLIIKNKKLIAVIGGETASSDIGTLDICDVEYDKPDEFVIGKFPIDNFTNLKVLQKNEIPFNIGAKLDKDGTPRCPNETLYIHDEDETYSIGISIHAIPEQAREQAAGATI